VSCLWIATMLYPGGYDWNRDYISTLLRGPSGPARLLADAGVLVFCVSISLVFVRLAHAVQFSKNSKVITIAGIGSQVYASLTITPMHDLMVTISSVFMLVALLALTQTLYASRERSFFVFGCACLIVLVASATIYYTGHYVSVLPWAQRVWLVLFTVWLLSLDRSFPRIRLQDSEKA
jgi:lysylphosphatidylglycerol synthetase-like protein (DUF2156 family)